ncbi:hypothetical protein B0T26DRAFT_655867 [Lasiosphaeria miniovina]|uniref:Zn(2)-C6 fungal-type domain-containing protein n=1 Tax=Lasiosphaeria miniovina TaxID=1954250 RepID=A0AA40A071_9PEZI|nr:uncharacterized protein B0T26DRAFT_655867 [Lasiosphaeria miniovina]KAK0706829.1 hypothetical protein B0T26DRAFT_655867 [Lasiosphaeria miniovina]
MLLARQRLERRGHTKSRRGCFNCKRRRIKCQETRPACGHCVKTGLNCEYPAVPLVVHQPQHQIPVFSMQDMRFFQHFLLQCYPHHPIGSESIWTHEIPCLSQKARLSSRLFCNFDRTDSRQYDYLMHAILGLAASELLCEDASLAEAAMTHRLKAIRAIKKAIAETAASAPPDGSFEEGNALMATCYALTFQSVLLDDGMAEYMTFIRGIILVGIQMYVRRARLIFGDLMGEQAEESKLAPHMAGVPLIERAWVDGAVAAIAALEPLAARHPVERRYHEMIENMARQLYVSSWGAYKALTQHYAWWMMLPHEQFQRLVDPANQPAVLLAAHWIALKQIMEPVTDAQKRAWADGGGGTSDSLGMIRWLKYLNRLVGAEYRAYNDWPVWVEQQLAGDRGFFGRAD